VHKIKKFSGMQIIAHVYRIKFSPPFPTLVDDTETCHLFCWPQFAPCWATLGCVQLAGRGSFALVASVMFALCSNAPLVTLMHPCTLESELFFFFARARSTLERVQSNRPTAIWLAARRRAGDSCWCTLLSVINIRDRHRPRSDCQPPAAPRSLRNH
jgi:hypothetical protein